MPASPPSAEPAPPPRRPFAAALLLLAWSASPEGAAQAPAAPERPLDGFEEETGEWVRFGAEDGLPGPVRRVLAEDARVLAATEQGLWVYDGWRFARWEADLPPGEPTDLARARDERLWAVVQGALYESRDGGFRRVPLPEPWSLWPVGSIASIASIHAGDAGEAGETAGAALASFWCAEDARWRVAELAPDGAVRAVETPSRASAPHAPNLRRTASGRVWLAQDDGVYLRERGAWRLFLRCDGAFLSALCEAPSGHGLIGLARLARRPGLWTWPPGGEPVEVDAGVAVVAAALAPDGRATVVCDGGEVRERVGGAWRPAGALARLCADAAWLEPMGAEDLWVGDGEGVALLRRSAARWTRLGRGGPYGADDRVHALAVGPDGALWAATAGGIVVRDGERGPDGARVLPSPIQGAVTAIGFDREGRAWAAPGEGGCGLLVLEQGSWRAVRADAGGVRIGAVRRIRRDALGRLWFAALAAPGDSTGASGGAFALEDGVLRRFEPLAPGRGVHDVLLDSRGALWLATTHGVERHAEGERRAWAHGRGELPGDATLRLAEGRDGRVWFASRAHLGWIEPSGEVEDDPAPPPHGGGFADLASEPDGGLWVTSERGLFRRAGSAWIEVAPMGAPEPVALGALIAGPRLFAGSADQGVFVLDRARGGGPGPRITVTEPVARQGDARVVRFGASTWWGEFPAATLPARFRLDGGAWSPWGLERELVLAGLARGAHRLELQAATPLGARGPTTRIELKIPPPAWLRPGVAVPATTLLALVLGIAAALVGRHRGHGRALRRREHELRLLLDEALDAILIFDGQEPRVVEGNARAEALFLRPREALAGRLLAELLDGFDPPRAAALERDGELVQEFRARRPAGAPIEVEASMRIIEGRRGLAILRDLTERRHLEAERREFDRRLAETQKLESLGRLAGGVAHDFNNLLMIVGGSAEQARRLVGRDSPAGPALQRIQTSVERAGELTQKLLAYAGRKPLRREPVDLARLARDAVALTAPSLPARARLQVDVPDDLPPALGDSGGLHQVLLNLLLNAGEALGRDGGTIRIAARVATADDLLQSARGRTEPPPVGRWVALEVEDDGAGMDEATLRHAFDPFFTTKASGHGLGLAAVRGILRSLGGEVRVSSAIGAGTRFTVLLPISREPPAPRAAAAREERGARGRVLLVDDEPEVRQVLREMLEDLGLDVTEAEGGRAAVAAHRRAGGAIDCTLLDVSMPDVGGVEAARRIRALDPAAPIVLMSGFHEAVEPDFAAQGFLQKPFRSEEVARLLRSVIGGTDGGAGAPRAG